MEDGKKWYQSKTVWTGAAGVLASVSGYATGEMTTAQSIQTALIALIGIFQRLGTL